MIPRNITSLLENWASRFPRGPLLIEGALGTGKSFLVMQFAKKFHQFIHIDLTENTWQKFFLKHEPCDEILNGLFFLTGKSLTVKRTLIFLDEIQKSPAAINWVKELHTSHPDLFLIAALSRRLQQQEEWPGITATISCRLFIYPCTFSEFLEAIGDPGLTDAYREVPFPILLREKLMNKFHLYSLIGGMPEIIQKYLQDRHLSGLKPIYDQILERQLNEIDRVSRSKKHSQILRFTLQNAFPFAATRIKFRDFSNSSYRSREMSESFRQLEKLRLVNLVYPVISTDLPLETDASRSPRLQLLDTGLVNYFSGIQKQLFHSDDMNALFKGQIARHVAGQELIAADLSQDKIHFWRRQKLQSTAEVDFIFPYNNLLIPVEVKSGEAGRLRSLHQFMDEASHPYAIRLYAGPISIRQTRTIKGKNFFLMSLPYFLAGRISEHLEGFIKFVNAI